MIILYLSLGSITSLTDHLNHVQILSKKMPVYFIGFEDGKKHIEILNANIEHLKTKGPILDRLILLWRTICFCLKNKNVKIVLPYFKFCFIFGMAFRKLIYLDVRTASVHHMVGKRYFENLLIKMESLSFKKGFVISQGVKNKLGLKNNFLILPLGANQINSKPKKWDSMRLIYVGTFTNRNLSNFINGFQDYLENNSVKKNKAKLIIVGFGNEDDLKNINESIKNKYKKMIRMKGEIRQPSLQKYLNWANIGVSYIPITDYYDSQPPTKTFEYLMNGMAVIATATNENKKIISNVNGVISKDNPISIADSLRVIADKLHEFDSLKIKESVFEYTWEDITKNKLLPYLKI